LQNATEGSLQWVDQAQKRLQGMIDEAKTRGNRYEAMQMQQAKDKLLTAADTAFPDYAKARGIVAKNMQDVVVPMQQSQVGKLAGSPNQDLTFNQQAGALLPEKPMDVTPQVIARTRDTIAQQDPNIMRELIAQYLRGTMNESAQGQNPNGGAQFAAKVSANPTQAANLAEALKGTNQAPLNDMLSIFKAQGMRPEAGSQTAANMAEQASLGDLKLPQTMIGAAKIPFDWITKYRNASASSDLAKAFSEGNRGKSSIDALSELARTNGKYDPVKQ